ncbi:MAG TPA: N-acetylmuramoyl-L-alanine amidase-like domain-containing protein [Paludibacter sp.]|nr:N-acetylmuramoyl-L-alanine amidase-like domain-containing protein [Paludibacter sp.]
MKKYKFLFLLFTILCIQNMFAQERNIIYQKLDTLIFHRYIQSVGPKKQSSIGDLMIQTAVFLMDSPYVPKTLEVTGKNEKLVVNLRQFDCSTLVENCLALVHTLKSKDQSFDTFCSELKTIRYRNGNLTDFSSRLHYFTEWISNNETKGKVINLTKAFGGNPLPLKLDFMTRKADLYPQMSNPSVFSELKTVEQNISQRNNFYIPKSSPVSAKIRNGDILCLTTNVQGLDISHVGIAFKLGNELYFLHASQTDQKVEISSEPFIKYIARLNRVTGYMVVRPL